MYLPRNISPRLANPQTAPEESPHSAANEIIIKMLLFSKFL